MSIGEVLRSAMSSNVKQQLLWQKSLLTPENSIKDAVSTIDQSGLQIAMVIDDSNKLLGTITDGDIRRALLADISLDTPLTQIMFTSPLVVTPQISSKQVLDLMKLNKIHKVPIVNAKHQVIGLHLWEQMEIEPKSNLDTPFVIMAGGLGSRLRPYTETCPKPMLKVAGKPMLEHIIERAKEEGFHQFIISINYLGEQIKAYFGKGKRWGVSITYLEEESPLGTAGALEQLKQCNKETYIISNGDVISEIRYQDLLNFHINNKASATMAVRTHEWQNPFGVVKLEGQKILGFEEKPTIKSQINAGLYVLNKDAINLLEPNSHCDMPTLFSRLKDLNKNIIAFPMHEHWIDVGRHEDLETANQNFN